ncbi:MAG: SPOR domain-containing protein [Thermodesulfobacteriota bacterium]|nr:SPOR domain-containing protein [Thermodesulfobacteriota bacterium]
MAMKESGLIWDYTIRTLDWLPPAQMNMHTRNGKEYALYVGFSKKEANANYLVRRLEELEFDSFLVEEEVSGNMLYRVYVALFSDKQEALSSGSELKRRGAISYFRPVLIDHALRGKYLEAKERKESMSLSGRNEEGGERTPRTYVHGAGDLNEDRRAYAEHGMEEERSTRHDTSIFEEERASYQGTTERFAARDELALREERMAYTDGLERRWADMKKDSSGPFSLSLQTGFFISGDSNDFKVGTSDSGIWEISDGTALKLALVPSFRLNRYISLDGGLEGIFADGIDSNAFTVGPRLTWEASKNLIPYFKMGAVYATLDWEDAPGDFDNSTGWEAGFGLHYLISQLRFGAAFSYRSIEFDYNAPSVQDAGSNQESIDFSGYSVFGSLAYYF